MITENQIVTEFSSGDVPRAVLGESPVVDETAGKVWWVDTAGRRLYRTDLETRATQVWDMPEEPGFVVLDRKQRPVVGMQTGLFLFEPEPASLRLLLRQEKDGYRFNDATVDANGMLWVSTIALDLGKGKAAIHRVTRELSLEPVVTGLSIPNGMAVDARKGLLYYSDSHWDIQTIWTVGIDRETGGVGEPVVFASTMERAGRPDGAALDAEGRYWIAAVDGAALYVYAPDGAFLFEVPLPVKAPTKLAFWGKDRDRLVITSKDDGDRGGRLMFVAFGHELVQGLQQPNWSHDGLG